MSFEAGEESRSLRIVAIGSGLAQQLCSSTLASWFSIEVQVGNCQMIERLFARVFIGVIMHVTP